MDFQTGRRYVAGVDGGGTKTACMIVDECGKLLAYEVAPGSNHQISGFPLTLENVCQSINKACERADILLADLEYIYLGMAGADSVEDFRRLNHMFAGVFGAIPYEIVNDVWIAFACEEKQQWGAVSICGTGNNLAVKDKEGKTYSVRALRYMLGNYGGGHHLAEIAMHYAFRSDENTGAFTRLAQLLPEYCECRDMDDLAQKVCESNYQYHRNYNIPKLVFDLAWEQDGVCCQILAEMGTQLGTMLGTLICRAGLGGDRVPVVLAGSQYAKDDHGLLVTPLQEALHRQVPQAFVRVVRCPPATGAACSALEKIGINLSSQQRRQIQRYVLECYG